MAFVKTLGSADLLRLRKDVEKFPPDWPKIKAAKELSRKWAMKPDNLQRWITVACGLPEESIHFYDDLGKDKAYELATLEVGNPSHRVYLVEKAVTEGLTLMEICRVKEYVEQGRSPVEAIDIVKGRRPEKPLTRKDQLSLGKLVQNLVKDGKDWRVTCNLIRLMGKIQVLQNNRLCGDLLTDIVAIQVEADDMRRHVEEILKDIPKELTDAFVAEYRRDSEPADGDLPRPPIIDVDFLPAPKKEEASAP